MLAHWLRYVLAHCSMVKICVGSLVKICASSLLDMWRLIDKENRCVGSLIRRCTGSLVNRTYVLAHWLKGTVSQDFYPFSNSFKLNFCSPSWPLIDILKCSIYEYCMAIFYQSWEFAHRFFEQLVFCERKSDSLMNKSKSLSSPFLFCHEQSERRAMWAINYFGIKRG